MKNRAKINVNTQDGGHFRFPSSAVTAGKAAISAHKRLVSVYSLSSAPLYDVLLLFFHASLPELSPFFQKT